MIKLLENLKINLPVYTRGFLPKSKVFMYFFISLFLVERERESLWKNTCSIYLELHALLECVLEKVGATLGHKQGKSIMYNCLLLDLHVYKSKI